MAKAPHKVIDFDGSGNVWFKVFQISAHADPSGNSYPTFPANSESTKSFPHYSSFSAVLHSVSFIIPKNVPTGQ
jgi:hypothetical protein